MVQGTRRQGMTSKLTRNVQLDRVNVWYGQGNSIHISSDDRRIVDESGTYKGLNIAISKTRQPKMYKYLDLLLQREGIERR
jgi:hypothetical protein